MKTRAPFETALSLKKSLEKNVRSEMLKDAVSLLLRLPNVSLKGINDNCVHREMKRKRSDQTLQIRSKGPVEDTYESQCGFPEEYE